MSEENTQLEDAIFNIEQVSEKRRKQISELQTAYDAAHSELVRMTDQLAACRNVANELGQQRDELLVAAQAVIDRWDTPLWKDVPATAEYINALRDVVAKVKP